MGVLGVRGVQEEGARGVCQVGVGGMTQARARQGVELPWFWTLLGLQNPKSLKFPSIWGISGF